MRRRGAEQRGAGGFSLPELLAAAAIGLFVILGGAALAELSSRQGARTSSAVEARRAAQVTLDHLARTLRQSRTGRVVDNAANCLACHDDSNGELVDDPSTACPLDMSSPAPPIDVRVFDLDPAAEEPVPVDAEWGKGIELTVDLDPAPDGIDPALDVVWERRSFYPLADPLGEGWMLHEDADHDGDGAADDVRQVAYGVRDISFHVERRPPAPVADGTPVSTSCYQPGNGSGCHGTGNPFGPDLYGEGVKVDGGPGEVWEGLHPDSQSVLGVRVRLRTGITMRTGPDARLAECVLEAFVRPRGLDP